MPFNCKIVKYSTFDENIIFSHKFNNSSQESTVLTFSSAKECQCHLMHIQKEAKQRMMTEMSNTMCISASFSAKT